jgi:DnaJ-class molecular chaperone
MKDFYKVLGIPRNASQKEVRAAFLRLATALHPDKHVGNEAWAKEMFQPVQEAYEVLNDPQKRAAYDKGPRVMPTPPKVAPEDALRAALAGIAAIAAMRAQEAVQEPGFFEGLADRIFGGKKKPARRRSA